MVDSTIPKVKVAVLLTGYKIDLMLSVGQLKYLRKSVVNPETELLYFPYMGDYIAFPNKAIVGIIYEKQEVVEERDLSNVRQG